MAELYTIIVKNNSGSDQEIEELGIIIEDGSSYNISDQFDYFEIFSSDSLRSLVSNGDLVINNGASDLSDVDGLDWIEVLNKYTSTELFYKKTELSTSGGSSVHWHNITNAPSFGSMAWKTPVNYIVLNSNGSTSGAVAGDIIVNGGNYEQYDGSTWSTIGSVLTGDRVIDLDQATNSIIEYDGSVWIVPENAVENDAVMVNDDGDGKQAQYVYDGSDWVKIGDVDFAHHFDGGASKHDATEIDVEGAYSNIPGTPDDLENTIQSIDTVLGTITASANDNNTLGEAYNEGGYGQGRVIQADSGAVKIVGSGGYSPLELSELSSLPNTGLAGGQLCVVNGTIYVYDANRLKWLSVQRDVIEFGRKGKITNGWLSFNTGNLPSNNSGFRLWQNAVITKISAQCDKNVVNGPADVHVRRNDVYAVNIATLTISSGTKGTSDVNYNVDVLKDEYLQCKLEKATTGGVEDIVVRIELAYTI